MSDMADPADETASRGAGPRLTHFGINVVDLDKMVEFYTRMLGMIVSDRGHSKRLGHNLAFLTADPEEHHQLVMVDSRKPGDAGNVNQISFRLGSLDDLKAAHERLVAAGIEVNPISHGNAWSVYFSDPEGNLVEAYVPSPFHTPQPRGDKLDLSLSNEAIARETEARLRSEPGFMTRADWMAKMAAKLGKTR
jgi:catechol 2,3-dioxygenase-like lactoylglutathione lyase family enzyme